MSAVERIVPALIGLLVWGLPAGYLLWQYRVNNRRYTGTLCQCLCK